MLENLAIYLPSEEVDLQRYFPEAQYVAAATSAEARYEIPTRDGVVILNLMVVDDNSPHIQGFLGYIRTLPAPHAAVVEASRRVARAQLALGVILPAPIERDGQLMTRFWDMTNAEDGFMFYDDSVIVDRAPLVGPAR